MIIHGLFDRKDYQVGFSHDSVHFSDSLVAFMHQGNQSRAFDEFVSLHFKLVSQASNASETNVL